MQIIKVKDKNAGGKKAFALIHADIDQGAKVLGLATGSTPGPLYSEMRASRLDFSDMTSINLDEYIGLPPENPESYHYFMQKNLFDAKPFRESFVPDGMANDLAAECRRYDQVIKDHPIDIQILGIGENGHIGFNEPGTSFETHTHRVQLTESTIQANRRFFASVADVPTEAISMGIASIMQSKKIILMAYGEKKAKAVQAMVAGPVSEEVPASVLQRHPQAIVIVDEAAAAMI